MKHLTIGSHPGQFPSEAELCKLEEVVGMPLPQDYRKILISSHPFTFDDEHGEPLIFEVEGFGDAVLNYLFGFHSQNYDLLENIDCYEGRIPINCLPIADDPAGNLFLLHLPTGAVYLWDHEDEGATVPEVEESENVYKVAESFSALLEGDKK